MSGATAISPIYFGTWTIVLTLVGGSGNIVPEYLYKDGSYIKIGKNVMFFAQLSQATGANGAGTGQLTLNLPFPVKATAHAACVLFCGNASNASSVFVCGAGLPGGATTMPLYYVNGTTPNVLTGADQNAAGRSVYVQGMYELD